MSLGSGVFMAVPLLSKSARAVPARTRATLPPEENPMSHDVVFDGGSDADRVQVLDALHAYLTANATFDWKTLAGLWSHDPRNVFFNMNGHTYVGLEHWTKLWQYYHDRLE